MNNSQIPEARQEGLVIQDMPLEVLVYDLQTNKAHCLNQTAAFVWKACDGKNTVTDITDMFSQISDNPVNEDLIWLAIDQLSEKNLLKTELITKFHGESRRSVIKKIGFAAVVALPVVASLVAPTSALANASCGCLPDGITCGSGCAGNCNAGVPVNCN